jgi:hypothetical protein
MSKDPMEEDRIRIISHRKGKTYHNAKRKADLRGAVIVYEIEKRR